MAVRFTISRTWPSWLSMPPITHPPPWKNTTTGNGSSEVLGQ